MMSTPTEEALQGRPLPRAGGSPLLHAIRRVLLYATLVIFTVLFIATYVAAYLMIVRFKVPRWLRDLANSFD